MLDKDLLRVMHTILWIVSIILILYSESAGIYWNEW